MSSELIALIVAIGLGVGVAVLGLRRNLSETTRANLPRSEGAAETAVAMANPSGRGRPGTPLSPVQARYLALTYLLLALGNAAIVVLASRDRTGHAIFAAMCSLVAVVAWLRATGRFPRSKPSADRQAGLSPTRR